MAGALTAKALDATRDENGTSFRQAAQAIGYESTGAQVGLSSSCVAAVMKCWHDQYRQCVVHLQACIWRSMPATPARVPSVARVQRYDHCTSKQL